MSFKNKYINITCWTGKNLLNAPYDSKEVDKVLDANRCNCDEINDKSSDGTCLQCDDTGYIGDFEVTWEDETDKDGCNIYDYINY